MKALNDIVMPFCAMALFCALLKGLVSPKGTGKYVELLASLVLLSLPVVLFAGLWQGDPPMQELPDKSEDAEYSSADWLVEQSAKEIGKSVFEYVRDKHGIDGARVFVTVDDSEIGSVVLKKVTVDLRHLNVVNRVYELEAELEGVLSCTVEVLVR